MPSEIKKKEGVLFSGQLPIRSEGLKESHTGYTKQMTPDTEQKKESAVKLKKGLDAFIVEEGQGTLG